MLQLKHTLTYTERKKLTHIHTHNERGREFHKPTDVHIYTHAPIYIRTQHTFIHINITHIFINILIRQLHTIIDSQGGGERAHAGGRRLRTSMRRLRPEEGDAVGGERLVVLQATFVGGRDGEAEGLLWHSGRPWSGEERLVAQGKREDEDGDDVGLWLGCWCHGV